MFILLTIYLCLYYIRPAECVASLQGLPILSYVGLTAIVCLLAVSGTGRIKLFRFKTDVMMAGVVAAIVLSHLSHGYFGGAFESFNKFLPSVVGYFLVAYSLDSRRKIDLFILLLIALSTFLGFEACLQSVRGVSHGGMTPLTEYHLIDGVRTGVLRGRWFGVFNDPNDLGLALVIPIPFLVDRLLKKSFLLPAISMPLLLYALYLTNSRGAMLAVCAALFSYAVIRFRSVKGVALGLSATALIALFGPSRMGQLSGSDASAHGRVEAWYAAFQMFRSAPLFGVGKGMFTDFNRLTAHNSYMLVLAELGAFGSFFFLGLFFYPLRWCKNNIFKSTVSMEEEADRCLLAAAFGSLIGLMSAMFFLSRSYILIPFMMVALLTVLINRLEKRADHKDDKVADRFYLARVGGLVIVEIAFMNVVVKFLI